MNGLFKTLILGVTVSSLFAAVAMSWVHSGALREIVRFAAGLMITIAILTPLTKLQLLPWRETLSWDSGEIDRQIAQAQLQSQEYLQQTAAAQIESYLSGCLREHGIPCSVTVSLASAGDMSAAKVTLTGSEESLQAAGAVLTGECGIAKENISYVEGENT